MFNTYIRAGKLPLFYLENLSGLVSKSKRDFNLITEILFNVPVKLNSLRYRVFKESQTCYICGLEASYLAVEQDIHMTKFTDQYHINMYGVKDEKEILFTKDHVIPKSRGGTDVESNLKTCCSPCNWEKGNTITQ